MHCLCRLPRACFLLAFVALACAPSVDPIEPGDVRRDEPEQAGRGGESGQGDGEVGDTDVTQAEDSAVADPTDGGLDPGAEDGGVEDDAGGSEDSGEGAGDAEGEDTTDDSEDEELDCLGIKACADGVNPDDREALNACLDAGSLVAQTDYLDMVRCDSLNCGGHPDAEERRECNEIACSEELARCEDAPPIVDDPPLGPFDCSEILDCVALLAPDDEAGRQACEDAGTFVARSVYARLSSCDERNCASFSAPLARAACIQDSCSAELSECNDELTPPIHSTGCVDYLQCVESAPDDPTALDCQYAVSPADYNLGAALLVCAFQPRSPCLYTSGLSELRACTSFMCPEEHLACFGAVD